ncbi:MAG: transcription-repair coupling factor [Lentisphaerae bacterium]|nr:transcription-repair coupling factor [Lentisphaerota bacterium]
MSDGWLDRIRHLLHPGPPEELGWIPLSAVAELAWLLRGGLARNVLVVCDNASALDDISRDLIALAPESAPPPLCYPAWDALPNSGFTPQPEITGDRLNTLQRLRSAAEPRVVASCVQALMQLAPEPGAVEAAAVRVAPGVDLDPEALALRLAEAGYDFVPEVSSRNQAARRGGILDVWPAQDDAPFRVEFLGNTVESVRAFDPRSQLSTCRADSIRLCAFDEWRQLAGSGAGRSLVRHLPGGLVCLWPCSRARDAGPSGSVRFEDHAAVYWEAVVEARAEPFHISFEALQRELADDPDVSQFRLGWLCPGDPAPGAPGADSGAAGRALPGPDAPFDLGISAIGEAPRLRRDALEPDILESERRRLVGRLCELAKQGFRVRVFLNSPGALERFRETNPGAPFELRAGVLSDGFSWPERRLVVVSESNLTGRGKRFRGRYDSRERRRPARGLSGETITDWMSLEPGDLVVHLDHGIGRYLGVQEIVFRGKPREVMAIEYADKARLYVPVSQAHLLSRYVGVGGRAAALHRLGGAKWKSEKAAAEKAVHDLAATLLETQAMRDTMDGHAFAPDTAWQHEFENDFPYEETPDQARALADVKRDMESPRPMDRLVCGDVGYGKTEVAMRAAFKAILDGRQVAVLVPTTVLAQQHFDLFSERMAAYPVRMELLCRFRPPHEQKEAVRALGAGAVDIVIGTHRLLQADVRFKNLGLLIIDEEQRFGVSHKEWLKRFNSLVDVLTLTATPIPRTLYMSLSGVRDISMIQTPPRDRLPIQTVVAENTDENVRLAILREINRGGQVYFLHNRIFSIHKVRERLARIVPEARVEIGHGRMPPRELSRVVRLFADGGCDVLLCTTIIESGVDIPNVNTLLVDRPDRFGLADLYQLRGRVGRSSRKAYACFLLPRHGAMLDTARRRLRALLEHSELGAGFKLAMRDLEMRGAGNLLGPEQSGHIAAVGFDLYCQLLRRTVALMEAGGDAQALPPIINVDVDLDFIDLSPAGADPGRQAAIPIEYADDESERVRLYRRIASAASGEELDALRGEIADRFGPVPPPLGRLLKIARIRIAAALRRAASVKTENGKVIVSGNSGLLMAGRRLPRIKSADPDARLDELLGILERARDSDFSGPRA